MSRYKIKVSLYNILYELNNLITYSGKKTVEPVCIAGVTRGGTTWLMEMMYTPNMQVVWEPLKYANLVKSKGEDFARNIGIIPYIPENAVWDEAYEYFDKLLNNKLPQKIDIKSHYLQLTNPFNKNRALIKFCYSNLLLPWLCRNFAIKPTIIIRNPYAVIESQLRHPGYRNIGITHHLFDLNQPKYTDVFEKYEQPISGINSQISMLSNWWAIQHAEILQHPDKDKLWNIIYYEDLVRDTQKHLQEILAHHHIEKDIQQVDFTHPSATALSKTMQHDDYLNKWRTGLTIAEKDCIEKILSDYNIPIYEHSQNIYGTL